MSTICEVCSSEASKYRCPACELMSCSLACSQAHKVYCAPKPPSQAEGGELGVGVEADNNTQEGTADQNHNPLDTRAVDALLAESPALRSQLRDIYTTTLEEEWVAVDESQARGRAPGRGRGRGRGGGQPRHRGAWTREKGFNRGLGKVRKYRLGCEEGTETGEKADAFMRFVGLVVGESHGQSLGES